MQIAPPDDFLWPDMSARITFLEPLSAAGGRGSVLVPRTAVHTDGGKATVWTVSEGRVRQTPVTVGKEFGDQVEITAGLSGGETVVIGSPRALRDGEAVVVAGAH